MNDDLFYQLVPGGGYVCVVRSAYHSGEPRVCVSTKHQVGLTAKQARDFATLLMVAADVVERAKCT